jgi:hypothetical protein
MDRDEPKELLVDLTTCRLTTSCYTWMRHGCWRNIPTLDENTPTPMSTRLFVQLRQIAQISLVQLTVDGRIILDHLRRSCIISCHLIMYYLMWCDITAYPHFPRWYIRRPIAIGSQAAPAEPGASLISSSQICLTSWGLTTTELTSGAQLPPQRRRVYQTNHSTEVLIYVKIC